MSVSERILEVMERMDITPYVLENECGIKYAQAKISHYKKGVTKSISGDIIIRICEAYPQVNANYILTGRGGMFIGEKQDWQRNDGITLSKTIETYKNIIMEKDGLIKELKNELDALTRENDRLTGENNAYREVIGLGERKPQKSA